MASSSCSARSIDHWEGAILAGWVRISSTAARQAGADPSHKAPHLGRVFQVGTGDRDDAPLTEDTEQGVRPTRGYSVPPRTCPAHCGQAITCELYFSIYREHLVAIDGSRTERSRADLADVERRLW